MKLFETVISRFKNEVGKSKQMTAREMKLIEICYDEMVVKNLNIPAVNQGEGIEREPAVCDSICGGNKLGVWCDGCEDKYRCNLYKAN